MSNKKPSIFQPNHAGQHTTVPTHPGMAVSHTSHGYGAEKRAPRGAHPNIALNSSRGKHVQPVPVHGGMTKQQSDGMQVGGRGHAVATVDGGQSLVTSQAASPLVHAYGSGVPKPRNAPPISPGMRSRTSKHDPALGAAILAEAFSNSNK